MDLPLRGVRVIDFTWVVAGPLATRMLADHGAEVIKVERKAVMQRRVGTWAELNRNKRSIAVNMNRPEGVALAKRLVAVGDIVVDNFSARVMGQWGMDYQSLVKVKPDIICLSMSGMGHSGPLANYVTYGATLQAWSGITMKMATDERPAGFGYSFSDMVAGHTAALAALIALWHRARTGQGQFIDLSQFEALVGVLGVTVLDQSVNGRVQQPSGWRPQETPAAPHGAYRCQAEGDDNDRWVAISVRSHTEWRRLVAAMGSPQWASEPRFHTLFSRITNREALDRHINEWTVQFTAAALMERLQRAGVAAGVVANAKDLCERDPQLKARQFWQPVSFPEGGGTEAITLPFRYSDTARPPLRHSPKIGEDRDYVLGEVLGLSAAEQQQLIQAQAVWE
ncbi:MAG TPA: CoA transferase [Candidatus Binataceae bacterium]|nr:CoA transferase [Candidatus Binataceae bacterium]